MTHENRRRRFVAPALLTSIFLISLVYCACSACRQVSIAEARSLPLGTVVTIDGCCNGAFRRFHSSTFDQGFAIQDRTGGDLSSARLTISDSR